MPQGNHQIRNRPEDIYSIITKNIPVVNVDMLARNAGISRKHLLSFCKKQYGRTPKQVIEEYRLFRSILFFISAKISVMDIALISGYNNTDSLTKAIKDTFGITPAELKKKIRVMSEEEKTQLVSEIYCRVNLFKHRKAIGYD